MERKTLRSQGPELVSNVLIYGCSMSYHLIMKASIIIADSREEVSRVAPWAKIVEPFIDLKDGWLACDTEDSYNYAVSEPTKVLMGYSVVKRNS